MQIKSPKVLFALKLLLLYYAFYYAIVLYIGLCAPGGLYIPFLEQHLNFIAAYRHLLIAGSDFIAQPFNLKTLQSDTQFLIVGRGVINIVYNCLGYGILSFLAAFSVLMPQKTLKNRLLFFSSNFLLVTFLNMLRIFLVAYYAYIAKTMAVDHHLIFNSIVYLILFISIFWWSKRSEQSLVK